MLNAVRPMDGTRILVRIALALSVAALPLIWVMLRQSPGRYVIANVEFSPDGKLLATFSTHDQGQVNEVRVWDLSSGRELRSERLVLLKPELTIAPDGLTITLNTPTGPRPLRELRDWPGRVLLNFARRRLAPDGRTLATACLNDLHLDRIQLWDLATGTLAGELSDGESNDHVAFSPDSLTLAGVRGRLALWDISERRIRGSPRIAATCVQLLAIAPDGSVIAAQASRTAGQPIGAVTLWDLTTGAVRGAVPMTQADSLAFAPDIRRLAIADDDTVTLYDLPSTPLTVTFRGHVEPLHIQRIKQLAWRLHVNPMSFVVNSVRALAFSPDGKLVASGDVHGTIRVWDAVTGQERLALVHQNDGVPAWGVAAAWLWGSAWTILAVRTLPRRNRSIWSS